MDLLCGLKIQRGEIAPFMESCPLAAEGGGSPPHHKTAITFLPPPPPNENKRPTPHGPPNPCRRRAILISGRKALCTRPIGDVPDHLPDLRQLNNPPRPHKERRRTPQILDRHAQTSRKQMKLNP